MGKVEVVVWGWAGVGVGECWPCVSYLGSFIGSRSDVNMDGWCFWDRGVYLSYEYRSPF